MSVPMWERRAFLGCVSTLLLSMPAHADEIAPNETSFAKTKPGQVQNVSIHYKTAPVAEFAPFAAVSPEAPLVSPQATPSVEALQREAGVAIYDIERGKVYLPDGAALEAHSGIGLMRDNRAFVHRRNRGPTPPHIYDLKLRERPFLGVEAIRLTPVGGDAAVFGRIGFLAHTYMLGRRGDSNGCIVFKEYHRFLAAFKNGEIKRLVVVPRLEEAPASNLTALLPAKNS